MRVAAVDTARLLTSTTYIEMCDNMFHEVGSFFLALVPVVGRLNERGGPNEDMWTTSYAGRELPEVDTDRPIHELLRMACL